MHDVILAQALESHDAEAAKHFEREYMPHVQAVARRVAGPRGADQVENFLADLVLPREDLPPRIATFVGRTSLRNWLRVVVANHCVGRLRSTPESIVARPLEVAVVESSTDQLDSGLARTCCGR